MRTVQANAEKADLLVFRSRKPPSVDLKFHLCPSELGFLCLNIYAVGMFKWVYENLPDLTK